MDSAQTAPQSLMALGKCKGMVVNCSNKGKLMLLHFEVFAVLMGNKMNLRRMQWTNDCSSRARGRA